MQESLRKLESLYKIKQDFCEFLSTHPPPLSLIAKDMQAQQRLGEILPCRPKKALFRCYGQKIYASSALNYKTSNYQVITGGYQLFLCENLSQHLEKLPDEAKSLVQLIQGEAIKVSKQEINAGKHTADLASRSMASGIILCCHSRPYL